MKSLLNFLSEKKNLMKFKILEFHFINIFMIMHL